MGKWGEVGWILELKFVSQVINKCSQLGCEKLLLNYLFIFWIYLLLYLFICIYLFIHWFVYLWMSLVNSVNCEQTIKSSYLYWNCFRWIWLFFFILTFLYLCVCLCGWMGDWVCLCLCVSISLCVHLCFVCGFCFGCICLAFFAYVLVKRQG